MGKALDRWNQSKMVYDKAGMPSCIQPTQSFEAHNESEFGGEHAPADLTFMDTNPKAFQILYGPEIEAAKAAVTANRRKLSDQANFAQRVIDAEDAATKHRKSL